MRWGDGKLIDGFGISNGSDNGSNGKQRVWGLLRDDLERVRFVRGALDKRVWNLKNEGAYLILFAYSFCKYNSGRKIMHFYRDRGGLNHHNQRCSRYGELYLIDFSR